MSEMHVVILNGPNLGLLGEREPEIYGKDRLCDIEKLCEEEATSLGMSVDFSQSNHEGKILDKIGEVCNSASGIIINPGALAHTSIALYDALLCCSCLVIEVHLSNIHSREPFRQRLFSARAAHAMICGLGKDGYSLALRYIFLKRTR